jgi:Carbohydrate esterase 2 N-terminal
MGILGAMIGYARIPDSYKPELDGLADTKFDFTEYSFNDIVKSTEARALKVVQQAGGKVSETEVSIPRQTPKSPKLALSNFGVPKQVVWVGDEAWNWQGNWTEKGGNIWADKIRIREAEGSGNEATLKFNGTGVALAGDLTAEGGRADVYVDGKKSDVVAEAYIVPKTHDNDLWRIQGLKSGEHTLRLVMRADADPRSKGKKLTISRAIVYQVN